VGVFLSENDLHHVFLSDSLKHFLLIQTFLRNVAIVVRSRGFDQSIDLIESSDPLFKLFRFQESDCHTEDHICINQVIIIIQSPN
jgi:hypothetical protein